MTNANEEAFDAMISTDSAHDHRETCRRLVDGIAARGLVLFARIDHAAGAREAGLELPDEDVLIFGHPRTGTPLMVANPRIGIELPLRVLVWTQDGVVRVGYRDPREWAGTYAVGEHEQILEGMAGVLEALAQEATV